MTLPDTMTESVAKGGKDESSTSHNDRKKELERATKEYKEQFYAQRGHEHINPAYTHLNEDLIIEDPIKIYDKKFGKAVEDYNKNQKRKSRKIGKGEAISAEKKAQTLAMLNIALQLNKLSDEQKKKILQDKKIKKLVKDPSKYADFADSVIKYSKKERKDIKHEISQMKQKPTYGQVLYEKMKNAKQQREKYEFIIQIGNADDFNKIDKNNKIVETKNREDPHGIWQLSKHVLKSYLNGFEERNPNMVVCNASIHMDELGSPHLHMQIIPVAETKKTIGYSKKGKKKRNGLSVKPSFNGALESEGFARNIEDNRKQFKDWQDQEFNALEDVMQHELGISRRKGVTNHLKNVKEYKKAKRLESEELAKYHDLQDQNKLLQKQIAEKSDELDRKQADLINTNDNLKKVLDDMDAQDQAKKDLADAKEKADKREKDLDSRQTNLDKKEKDLTARETAIIKKEKEQKEKDAELTKRETAVKKIEKAIAKIPKSIKKFFKSYFTERNKARGFNDLQASDYADDIVNKSSMSVNSDQVKYDLQAHDKASLKAFSKALPELGTVIPEVSKIAENVSEYAKNKEEDKSKTVEYETRAGHAGAVMREPDRATDHKDVEPDLTNEPDEPDLTDDL